MQTWLTLLPPLIAIALALATRGISMALLAGVMIAEILIADGNVAAGILGSVDAVTGVLGDAGNARILIFCLLIGGLLELMQASGGTRAFVRWLTSAPAMQSARSVRVTTVATGIAIFIETNISILATGSFSRPLFDQYRLSREQLAYLLDSTSSPVSVILVVNAWGAYVLALLSGYSLPEAPLSTLIKSIPLNFYALATLALVLYTAVSGRLFGPMAKTQARTIAREEEEEASGRVVDMLAPLAALLIAMPLFMLYTGKGNIIEGSGSLSVLLSVCVATAVSFALRVPKDGMQRVSTQFFDGMGTLLPIVIILLLSMALGASLRTLGTGEYLAGLLGANLPWVLLPALVFVLGGAISFSTGTSWGTFAIMMPLAIPLALATQTPPPLMVAAVLGGGVFGDHCSPISDSTIVSSLAAGCDHMDHVRTQLPYALATGTLSFGLFILAAWLM